MGKDEETTMGFLKMFLTAVEETKKKLQGMEKDFQNRELIG